MVQAVDLSDRRLIAVSNAGPCEHETDETGEIVRVKKPGGLTNALNSCLTPGDSWIACARGDADEEVTNEEGKVNIPDEDYILKLLSLSEKEVDEFYRGFSNKVFWPGAHQFLSKIHYSPEYLNTYKKVNRKYAEAAVEELTSEDDLIWFHDYHMLLAPKFTKKEKAESNVLFKMHIPWPNQNSFECIPGHEELMKGALNSDVMSFHLDEYAQNFMDCAEYMGAEVDRGDSTVSWSKGQTKVISVPLGIDYELFDEHSDPSTVKKLERRFPEKHKFVGVDRLDYTKGLPEKVRAVDILIENNPELKGEVSLIQRAPYSRKEIKEYQWEAERLKRAIDEVNKKYDYNPVKVFHDYLPEMEDIINYYELGYGTVTPKEDGMNLVAKEHQASQDHSPLILSKFAGAAEQLGDYSKLVNPYNPGEIAKRMEEMVYMDSDEMEQMNKRTTENVKNEDVQWWSEKVFEKCLEVLG